VRQVEQVDENTANLGHVRRLPHGAVQMSWRLGTMLIDALASIEKVRPRVCLMNTAMGDDFTYYAMAYEAFNAAGCDVTELKVFPQPSADPEERLCGSDLVWVAVARWRTCSRSGDCTESTRRCEARGTGVILGGVSAGSLCWHLGGTTDSFGQILQPVTMASASCRTPTGSTTTPKPSADLSCTRS